MFFIVLRPAEPYEFIKMEVYSSPEIKFISASEKSLQVIELRQSKDIPL